MFTKININNLFKKSKLEQFLCNNIKNELLKTVRDGFYVDSFTKKYLENLVKKVCIYSGIIFGEKYLMETLGPKLVDNIIWSTKNIFYFEHTSILTLIYQVIFAIFLLNFYFLLNFFIIVIL